VGLGTALLCVSFGGNAVAIKISLDGIGPLTTVGLRFAIAAPAIALWALVTGRSLRPKPGQVIRFAALGAVFALQMALFYWGMDLTLASRGILIANLQPFLLLLMAHFVLPGDRLTLLKLGGVGLGFVGVALMFAKGDTLAGSLVVGDLVIAVSVVIWAGSTVYVKRIIHDYEAFHLALYPMLVQAPLCLVAGQIWDDPARGEITARVIGSLLYQSLLTAAFGFVAWTALLKRYGAVAVNTYIFLAPVSGVVLAGALLGEQIATFEILTALVLIVGGIVMVNWRAEPPMS
jgi:drug/metabolite transporter (DMT)-like permease